MNTESAVPVKKNTLAIVSLVLGILALCTFPLIKTFALLFMPGAIICAIIALVQIKQTGQGGKGLAIAGLVLGLLSIVYVVVVVLLLISAPAITEVFNTISETLEP